MTWRARRKTRYYAKCSCGRVYDRMSWRKLVNLGVMHMPADDHGAEQNIEMRNCVCGSTIAVDHGPRVSRDYQRDPKDRYYVTVRFIHKGEPRQLVLIIPASDTVEAKKFSRFKLPKGAVWLSATATRMIERDPSRFRKSTFKTRVPKRKPDKCFVYRSAKGYSVTCAWASRRASRHFKREADAMRFARSLHCKVVKGSEYALLSNKLKSAVQKKVPIIMKEEGYSRGQAFAVAMSMALRGTIYRKKKKARPKKGHARMKPKRSKR